MVIMLLFDLRDPGLIEGNAGHRSGVPGMVFLFYDFGYFFRQLDSCKISFALEC